MVETVGIFFKSCNTPSDQRNCGRNAVLFCFVFYSAARLTSMWELCVLTNQFFLPTFKKSSLYISMETRLMNQPSRNFQMIPEDIPGKQMSRHQKVTLPLWSPPACVQSLSHKLYSHSHFDQQWSIVICRMCLTISYNGDDATAPLNPTDTSLFPPRDRRRTVPQAVSYVPIRSVLAGGDWTTHPIRL